MTPAALCELAACVERDGVSGARFVAAMIAELANRPDEPPASVFYTLRAARNNDLEPDELADAIRRVARRARRAGGAQ